MARWLHYIAAWFFSVAGALCVGGAILKPATWWLYAGISLACFAIAVYAARKNG